MLTCDMADLEFYLLHRPQDKPLKVPWKRDQQCINRTLKSDSRSFLVLFAHGPWPGNVESFKVDVKGETKHELGKLEPNSRALYYDLKKNGVKNDVDLKLTLMACFLVKDGILRETTAVKAIPNQRTRIRQLTDTISTPNLPPAGSKKEVKSLSSSSKKRKKTATETPENDESPSSKEKMTSASRRLRLSENVIEAETPVQTKGSSPPKAAPSKIKRDDWPGERWGHAMCSAGPETIILVGGQGPNQVISRDALWELNPASLSWTVPKVEHIQSRPDLRTGHTIAFDEILNLLFVFGGSKNVRWYNDLFVLDMKNKKWSHMQTTGKAPTRSYHTSTLYRGEMFIFGGIYPNPNLEPDSCSNDLFIFSSVSKSWYQPLVLGSKPKPRSGHSATLLGDKLVIFGGWDAPVCFNDIHILDLGLMEFVSPDVGGTAPSPRSWHGACSLSNNRVLIHGGYNGYQALSDSFIFCLDALTWQQVTLSGTGTIGARAGHTICSITDPSNEGLSKLLMFGGGDNEDKFFNDLQHVTITAK